MCTHIVKILYGKYRNMNEFSFAVLRVSTTCYKKDATDRSGPFLLDLLQDSFPNMKSEYDLVPDNILEIKQKLLNFADNFHVNAIFTCGGIGFSPDECTPEASKSVIDREWPQLANLMAITTISISPYAALSRAVCGIRNQTLIINFPGSRDAVKENFNSIVQILPYAFNLINYNLQKANKIHKKKQKIQKDNTFEGIPEISSVVKESVNQLKMISVEDALNLILKNTKLTDDIKVISDFKSNINIPAFRASIKDGYAVNSSSTSRKKYVIDNISAGDPINKGLIGDECCFKINTGAPLPEDTDCVIEIEKTKVEDKYIHILTDPIPGLDVRQIGSDLKKGSKLFPQIDYSPVVVKTMLASAGIGLKVTKKKIAIISSGSELLSPSDKYVKGKVYDSNTTMLKELIKYFGFEFTKVTVVPDSLHVIRETVEDLMDSNDFIICSGGVSVGDKDYIKQVLIDLKYDILFERVNMKPGKPMTFAINKDNKFFGLPGNPVSAFVTFHLLVLPALRYASGFEGHKCKLPVIKVKLTNSRIALDSRPEFARASITFKDGVFYATINEKLISSCIQSIVGADVLVHLPPKTEFISFVKQDATLDATVIRFDFISSYE